MSSLIRSLGQRALKSALCLISLREPFSHLLNFLDRALFSLARSFKKLQIYLIIYELQSKASEVLRDEQLLQLDVSVLGPPVPLLCTRLSVLRCIELVLLASLVQVRQQQLLGRLVPTLEVELGEGGLTHFDNLNIKLVKKGCSKTLTN